MAKSVRRARSRLEVAALVACAVCFALFCGNVLLGWSARLIGWDASWRLERVPEFLLLFASAISFAVAALAAERRAQSHVAREPPSG
jgi:TRAP-type C4-dicarboxylate transport system permease small subunit